MRRITVSIIALALCGCAAHILQSDRASDILKTDEYDKKLVIVESPSPNPPPEPKIEEVKKETPKEAGKKKPHKKKTHKTVARAHVSKHKKKVEKEKEKPGPRQPELEDSVGFEGRRPIVDPFRIGEKTVLNLTYFNIVAGTLAVGVEPFVTVNGKKSYHFHVKAKSNSFFNHIYAVDDTADTYLSYDDLKPFNLQISIKESKQLAETRTFFDWKTLHADYWQKKITKEHGETSKKLNWQIKDYSQNVISAAYYLRTFTMAVGKKLAFRVADEGKNIVFKGEVLRREKLKTDIGELDTWVIQPQLTVDGVFTPVGEILIWLTADDRKFLVRLESKIKIGSIVAKLKSLDKGQD